MKQCMDETAFRSIPSINVILSLTSGVNCSSESCRLSIMKEQIINPSVKIFSTSSNDLAQLIVTAGLAQAEREKGIDRADDTRPLTDGFVSRPVVANLPPAFVAISPEQS